MLGSLSHMYPLTRSNYIFHTSEDILQVHYSRCHRSSWTSTDNVADRWMGSLLKSNSTKYQKSIAHDEYVSLQAPGIGLIRHQQGRVQ